VQHLLLPVQRVWRQTKVYGARLDPEHARAVARRWMGEHRKLPVWAQWPGGRFATDAEAQAILHWLLNRGHASERPVSLPQREAGLWVGLVPGTPPNEVPTLETVAALANETLAQWASLLDHYGAPTRPYDLIVVHLSGMGYDYVRLSLDWLRGAIGRRAAFLLACEQAALGDARPLRRALRLALKLEGEVVLSEVWAAGALPHNDTDDALARLGRRAVARTVAEALARDLEPDQNIEPSEAGMARVLPFSGLTDVESDRDSSSAQPRGIPEATGLYAWGWWPLMVLDRWVHRARWVEPRKCAAGDCTNLVPPDRRRFCSERCRQREKKRRQRDPRIQSGPIVARRSHGRTGAGAWGDSPGKFVE
jgi:predicted nucleic acid-binding Zn ribbon protein